MKCKNCEKEIGNECRFCPHCGVETEPAPPEESIPISSNPVDLSENTAPAPPPQPDNPSVGVTQQSSANAVNLPFYKHWKIWAIVSGVLFLLLIAVSVLQPSAPSPRNDALVSTEAAASPTPQASAAAWKSKATSSTHLCRYTAKHRFFQKVLPRRSIHRSSSNITEPHHSVRKCS